MWGDYGALYRIKDNEYLAGIATHSRDVATRMASNELGRRYDVRVWVFEILQEAAWASHPRACRCPIEGLDPEAQVWACAQALQVLLAEECDRRDVDLPMLARQTSEEGVHPREWAAMVLGSAELVHQAEQAALEHATSQELRKRRP